MFKILVGEDDASTNRLFCAILRRAGYEPIPAVDGEDALRKLDEYKVDLLLCDVMMPRLDGFALTRMIRDSGSLLPVLMVTARALPEDKRQGFLVGTDDYTYHDCLAQYGLGTSGAPEGLRRPDYNAWEAELISAYPVSINSFINWFAKV